MPIEEWERKHNFFLGPWFIFLCGPGPGKGWSSGSGTVEPGWVTDGAGSVNRRPPTYITLRPTMLVWCQFGALPLVDETLCAVVYTGPSLMRKPLFGFECNVGKFIKCVAAACL